MNPRRPRRTTFARDFPAFAGLDVDQLLELVEETNIARALAARGEFAAADACFDAMVARLGIGAEVAALTAHLHTPKEGNR